MKEIGDTLKHKRETQKFSREYVNSQTHIPLKYIIAMEEWNVAVFPAEVYLLGSLRRYAKFLGLNAEDLIALSKRHMAQTTVEQKPVSDEPDERTKKAAALIIFAILLAAGAGILAWTQRGAVLSRYKTKLSVFIPVNKAPVPAVKPVPVLPEPAKKESYTLEIRSVERSWVKVSADKDKPFEGIIEAGSSKKWEAKSEFYISVGYVPGVRVYINGKPVDIGIGAKRDVNALTLTKSDLEKIIKQK